jgi:hypothetical protein
MLFEEMRNSGQVPDVPIFNMAIHIAAKSAQIEKAYARPRLSYHHSTNASAQHDTRHNTTHDTTHAMCAGLT